MPDDDNATSPEIDAVNDADRYIAKAEEYIQFSALNPDAGAVAGAYATLAVAAELRATRLQFADIGELVTDHLDFANVRLAQLLDELPHREG